MEKMWLMKIRGRAANARTKAKKLKNVENIKEWKFARKCNLVNARTILCVAVCVCVYHRVFMSGETHL